MLVQVSLPLHRHVRTLKNTMKALFLELYLLLNKLHWIQLSTKWQQCKWFKRNRSEAVKKPIKVKRLCGRPETLNTNILHKHYIISFSSCFELIIFGVVRQQYQWQCSNISEVIHLDIFYANPHLTDIPEIDNHVLHL